MAATAPPRAVRVSATVRAARCPGRVTSSAATPHATARAPSSPAGSPYVETKNRVNAGRASGATGTSSTAARPRPDAEAAQAADATTSPTSTAYHQATVESATEPSPPSIAARSTSAADDGVDMPHVGLATTAKSVTTPPFHAAIRSTVRGTIPRPQKSRKPSPLSSTPKVRPVGSPRVRTTSDAAATPAPRASAIRRVPWPTSP